MSLLRDRTDFAATIDAAASQLGINAVIIEKDYWRAQPTEPPAPPATPATGPPIHLAKLAEIDGGRSGD